MISLLRRATLLATLALPGIVATAGPLPAYPVDCAILLCLAGGWPATPPCAVARATFIRRITPWPIEPPLQIWNCPMRAAFNDADRLPAHERLFAIAFRGVSSAMRRDMPSQIRPVQSVEQADIDLSATDFDFVRSIRVFHIVYSQNENRDGHCRRHGTTRLGSYGLQGDYSWQVTDTATIPGAAGIAIPGGCRSYSYRSVFVDWRDQAGSYGSEEVRY